MIIPNQVKSFFCLKLINLKKQRDNTFILTVKLKIEICFFFFLNLANEISSFTQFCLVKNICSLILPYLKQ